MEGFVAVALLQRHQNNKLPDGEDHKIDCFKGLPCGWGEIAKSRLQSHLPGSAVFDDVQPAWREHNSPPECRGSR
jgi:hypothetical protein